MLGKSCEFNPGRGSLLPLPHLWDKKHPMHPGFRANAHTRPQDVGMLFLYPRPLEGSFVVADVLIPAPAVIQVIAKEGPPVDF